MANDIITKVVCATSSEDFHSLQYSVQKSHCSTTDCKINTVIAVNILSFYLTAAD